MLRAAETAWHSQRTDSIRHANSLLKQRGKPVYAALDLGTNNCRLLVAQQEGAGFRAIEAFSREVCLGEGLNESKYLSSNAMERAIHAIKLCAKRVEMLGVTHLRAVTTEACRAAMNQQEFIADTRIKTGVELEIISANKEAQLVVAGCAPLVDPAAEELLVFDIGGGSTEIAYVDLRGLSPYRKRLLLQNSPDFLQHRMQWLSLPIGVVTLRDRFAHIVDNEACYQAMFRYVDRYLKAKIRTDKLPFNTTGKGQVLGASGTITTLAGMHLGLKRYDRAAVDGVWIAREAVQSIIHKLMTWPIQNAKILPCVGMGHFDLLLSGSAILNSILGCWPVAEMRVADRGLREGVIYDLMASRKRHPRRFQACAVG